MSINTPEKPPLTFGIELEFLLATLKPNSPDPDPSDPRDPRNIHDPADDDYSSQKHIAAYLSSIGIPSKKNYPSSYLSTSERVESLSDNKWSITIDQSLRGPKIPNDTYEWQQIEVVSPVLVFSEEAIKQCGLVAWYLRQRYRIVINESCGFHVHVGNGRTGFPCSTVRNLASFLWTFEPQIQSIHPAHRRDNLFCRNIRDWSALSRECAFDEDGESVEDTVKVRKGLDMLMECERSLEIVEWMLKDDEYELAYCFEGLDKFGASDWRKTVEWRQHEMTLDEERIAMWIKTCVGLVVLADNVNRGVLESWLLTNIGVKEGEIGWLGIEQVLKKAGLDEQAEYYGKRDTSEERRLEEEKKEMEDSRRVEFVR